MLSPSRALSDVGSWRTVSEHLDGVGIVTTHKRGSRWPAICSLAISLGEACSLRGEAVDVGCPADSISVTGKRGRGEVIRNDEEDVHFSFCQRAGHKKREDQQGEFHRK